MKLGTEGQDKHKGNDIWKAHVENYCTVWSNIINKYKNRRSQVEWNNKWERLCVIELNGIPHGFESYSLQSMSCYYYFAKWSFCMNYYY